MFQHHRYYIKLRMKIIIKKKIYLGDEINDF
jgi:hypothetical protein